MEIHGYIDKHTVNLLPYVTIDRDYDELNISFGWLCLCAVITWPVHDSINI